MMAKSILILLFWQASCDGIFGSAVAVDDGFDGEGDLRGFGPNFLEPDGSIERVTT